MNDGNILFFSGGTAMRAAAGELAALTAGTMHIVTPFDSGGSSAAIRQSFAMPAVGDLRSRLLAVALSSCASISAICKVLSYRLPDSITGAGPEFQQLCIGRHPLIAGLPEHAMRVVTNWLKAFQKAMPDDFPLPGASVGNLFIAGGYLDEHRKLDTVIKVFADLVKARATVLPVVDADMHLAVRLESGRIIVGQHLFTGKECGSIDSPIADIWLTESLFSSQKTQVNAPAGIRRLVTSAGLICYPVGSFYSSVIANLLPLGMGKAIVANPCPKLFIPNLGSDPELYGHTLEAQIERILEVVTADAGSLPSPGLAVSALLVDESTSYPGGLPESYLRKRGIKILIRRLVSEESAPLADPLLLSKAIYGIWSANCI